MIDPKTLHDDAIVIDMTCPLVLKAKYVDWYREGGATAIAPTIIGASGNARSGFAAIGGWERHVRERDDTIIVSRAGGIKGAPAESKMALIPHCPGAARVTLRVFPRPAGLKAKRLCLALFYLLRIRVFSSSGPSAAPRPRPPPPRRAPPPLLRPLLWR